MSLYLFSILVVLKWMLKEIKLLQRSFLWGRNGLRCKWALVKWEKACLPKNGGGVGLRDLSHSNEVMGARIWWKWLIAPLTPWASLWTSMYASHCPVEERIRISEVSMGSLIWNSAKQHRSLIQQHSFWEVKNGENAKFWADSWQQMPKVKEQFSHLQPPEQNMQAQDKVKNFWKVSSTQDNKEWLKAD